MLRVYGADQEGQKICPAPRSTSPLFVKMNLHEKSTLIAVMRKLRQDNTEYR